MSLLQKQAKNRESVISVCLMLFLLLIGAVVFVRQFDMDMSRFGIEAVTGLPPQKSQTEQKYQRNFSVFAPFGYVTLTAVEDYNSDNLYEKINGKAPFYTETGFKQLITQRFVSTEDQTLWMELYFYDMGNIRNAFSVFSRQRRPESTVVSSLGNPEFAYKTANGLYFVHGHYYIEVSGSAVAGKLLEAIMQLGRNIFDKIEVAGNKKIKEFDLFAEGAIAGSFKLYLINAFGFEKLTHTLSARYEIDGEVLTAFVSQRADSENAKTIAEGYIKFLIENGATVKKEISVGKVLDFYGTTEIVLSVGNFIAGVHEAENQQAAEKLIKILVDKLNK